MNSPSPTRRCTTVSYSYSCVLVARKLHRRGCTFQYSKIFSLRVQQFAQAVRPPKGFSNNLNGTGLINPAGNPQEQPLPNAIASPQRFCFTASAKDALGSAPRNAHRVGNREDKRCEIFIYTKGYLHPSCYSHSK